MKCPHCVCWNRIEVDKTFVQQPSPEPKVEVLIPMYKPLETERCEKCGKVIAEPKELIRIMERALAKTVPRLQEKVETGRKRKVRLRQPEMPGDLCLAGRGYLGSDKVIRNAVMFNKKAGDITRVAGR